VAASAAKWGVGGAYTRGGLPQSGGSVDVRGSSVFTMKGTRLRATMAGLRVEARGASVFTMSGGRIQGGTDSDGFTKNIFARRGLVALRVVASAAEWGAGGAYTRGGVPKSGRRRRHCADWR
jgi:hypothetical protein